MREQEKLEDFGAEVQRKKAAVVKREFEGAAADEEFAKQQVAWAIEKTNLERQCADLQAKVMRLEETVSTLKESNTAGDGDAPSSAAAAAQEEWAKHRAHCEDAMLTLQEALSAAVRFGGMELSKLVPEGAVVAKGEPASSQNQVRLRNRLCRSSENASQEELEALRRDLESTKKMNRRLTTTATRYKKQVKLLKLKLKKELDAKGKTKNDSPAEKKDPEDSPE